MPEIKGSKSIKIQKVKKGSSFFKDDKIAVEAPVEILVNYSSEEKRVTKNVAITMRTPGNDAELALGFLLTEGIINSLDDVEKIEIKENTNQVIATLSENCKFDIEKLSRHVFTSSSCGVCGKASIDNLKIDLPNFEKPKVEVSNETIFSLMEKISNRQTLFSQTGGIHATFLFDLQGNLITLKEDVGRHNAMDKLLGWSLQQNIFPLNQHIILLSGRASFELIQKAAIAGCQVVVAIGAPSSLAIELAKEAGICLIGFLKEEGYNVYTF